MSIVTISRQVGSQGEEIAKLISQKLDLDLLTRERIHELTIQYDSEFGKACSTFENEVPKSFWARHFFDSAKRVALFEWLTYKLASQGNVVLLGRGTPVVLRHRTDVFRIRIVAPFKLRVEQIQKVLAMSHGEAENYVRSYGQRRRNLMESIFKVDLSDPELYDIQLNTAELTVEDAADILATGISAKTKSLDQEQSLKDLAWEAQVKKANLAIKNVLDLDLLQQIEVRSKEEGQVVISGFVTENWQRSKAEELALAVEAIEKVDNQLLKKPSY